MFLGEHISHKGLGKDNQLNDIFSSLKGEIVMYFEGIDFFIKKSLS